MYVNCRIRLNSMRKGIHDDALIEIFKKILLSSKCKSEQKKFGDYAKPFTEKSMKILYKRAILKTILMCGNKNFEGFQALILDSLI